MLDPTLYLYLLSEQVTGTGYLHVCAHVQAGAVVCFPLCVYYYYTYSKHNQISSLSVNLFNLMVAIMIRFILQMWFCKQEWNYENKIILKCRRTQPQTVGIWDTNA